jgi:AraC-like DNA-binding protein
MSKAISLISAHRAQTSHNELVRRLSRIVPADGRVEPLKGLHLYRLSSPTQLTHTVCELAFCVIAQGSKEILLGDTRYRYDSAHYLLTALELPVTSRVIDASPECPYLSLRLILDPALVSAVMVECDHGASHKPANINAISVCPFDEKLLDAVVRLVRLVDSPHEAPFLAPLITREIVYRLLMGEQGERLRHIAVRNDHTHHIATAIERVRRDFNQPLRIETIAREIGMSVSGFHHHFKTMTAMSPLQFQKRLRLQEARRLMLGESLDATSTAHRVGYGDASQFNREYKRLFGLPPRRDVERLRGTVVQNGA